MQQKQIFMSVPLFTQIMSGRELAGIGTLDEILLEAATEGKEGSSEDGGAVSGCVDDQLSNEDTQLILPNQR